MSGLSDARRDLHASDLAGQLTDYASLFAANRGLGPEHANVGVAAAIRTAFNLAENRGLDRKTAATLIMCIVEGMAYGR